MDVRVGLGRKLSAEELMLLNCSVGEDSWESLGLQGDQTSQSQRKSVLNIHWKDWCWSWSSNTLAIDGKNRLLGKDPDAERLKTEGEADDRGWDGWMASPTWWTWVWASSGSWWWTDREAWSAAVLGVAKSRTQLSDWTELFCVIFPLVFYTVILFLIYEISNWFFYYIVNFLWCPVFP